MSPVNGADGGTAESRLNQLLDDWAKPLRLTAQQVDSTRAAALGDSPYAGTTEGVTRGAMQGASTQAGRHARWQASPTTEVHGPLTGTRIQQYVDDLLSTYAFLRSPWWLGPEPLTDE